MTDRRRRFALLLCIAAQLIVGLTIAYGLYYRSEHYRLWTERRLSGFFGMPVEIRSIHPHTFSSRRFNQIRIWLPDRRSQIFASPRAIWDARGSAEGAVIEVHDASLLIGSDSWEKEDYMRVLRASLAHNFHEINISDVIFQDAKLHWMRRDMQMTMEGVEGKVHFPGDGTGTARFSARSLNEMTMPAPVEVTAQLEPLKTEFLREVTLNLPKLPLSGLGLQKVLQAPVTQGTFAGRITIHPSADGDQVELQGDASQILLAELTRRLPGGAITAEADLRIESARILGRKLEDLHFTGQIRKLKVDTLAPHLGFPQIGGDLRLHVLDGLIKDERIERLISTGDCSGVSLDTLTNALLGRAGVHGKLRITINSLTIEQNKLVGGDIDIVATPPTNGPGTIERDVLIELISKHMGLSLPPAVLPQKVEFLQIGAKLMIDKKVVRVLSLPGPAGPALITARLLGVTVPLLGDVDQKFEMEPLMARLADPLAQLQRIVRERLQSLQTRPAFVRNENPATTSPSRSPGQSPEPPAR